MRYDFTPGKRPLRKAVEATDATRQRARELRTNASTPERILWSYLRGRRLRGLRFRRQHPLGPYVADFYCHEAALVVELDSLYHANRGEHDRARDEWMRSRNIEVLRIAAWAIANDMACVLDAIVRLASSRASSLRTARPLRLEDSAPPPRGAEEGAH